MSTVTHLKTIKEVCDNPNCDLVYFYFKTTLAAVRFRRKVLSKIPMISGQCPHTYVKLTEVDLK